MSYKKIFPGLFFIQVLFLSCQKNEIIPIVHNYNYERFTSNLKDYVKCVHFVDEQTGYAASEGKICKTIDGGLNWKVDSISNLPINSIYFVNKNIGFAVGGKLKESSESIAQGSYIYKTADAGTTWVKQTVPIKDSELNSVCFINENIGFAIGFGLHVKTTDGGTTWNEFNFSYQGLMRKISFTDSNIGFAAGTLGNMFKTTDQGKNWTKLNLGSDGHIYDFSFVDSYIGYAAGEKSVAKTIDGGATWTLLTNSPVEISFIHFKDENNGIAIGKGHYTGAYWTNAIYCTLDGGITWTLEDNIDFVSIVDFPLKNKGYAVMANSTVKIEFK